MNILNSDKTEDGMGNVSKWTTTRPESRKQPKTSDMSLARRENSATQMAPNHIKSIKLMTEYNSASAISFQTQCKTAVNSNVEYLK